MDFQTLGSRTVTLLRQSPGSLGLFTSAELSAAINDANLQTCIDSNWYRKEGSVYTVSGTYQYALSASYMTPDLLSVWSVYYDGDKLVPARFDDPTWTFGDNITQGAPLRYRITPNYIEVNPKPDASKELRVFYTAKPATLVNNTATPELPSEYHQAIVFYACALMTTKDEKEARYNAFYLKYANLMKRLQSIQRSFDSDETIPLDPAVVSARRH